MRQNYQDAQPSTTYSKTAKKGRSLFSFHTNNPKTEPVLNVQIEKTGPLLQFNARSAQMAAE